MAIRTFATATNVHLFEEYNIPGVSMDVNDGKQRRKICACGHVMDDKESSCAKCGNTEFVPICANRWSRASRPIDVAVKPFFIRKTHHGFEVVQIAMVIQEAGNVLTVVEAEFVAATITITGFERGNTVNPCITDKTQIHDYVEYVYKHLNLISDDDIREMLTEAYELSIAIFGGINNVMAVYKAMSYGCIMHVLNKKNVSEYPRFFNRVFNKYRWYDADPLPGIMCTDMHDFFHALGLPVDYEAYYRSDDFDFSYYYYGGKDFRIEEAQLHALPMNLQMAMKNALEHKNIYLRDIMEIIEWCKSEPVEIQELLAKYIKRHGIMHQGQVFNKFKNQLTIARDNGYDVNDILVPRKFAMLEAMQLLSRRGFPQSRIDGFADVFDVNPEMGIGMLSSKAQLKKAEAEKIYK